MKGSCHESFDGLIAAIRSIIMRTVTILPRFGWGWISVVFSLLIVVVALLTLHHVLHDIDVGKVVSALRSQQRGAIGTAVAFVIAGYITLTFYDVFALRTIGHRAVPFEVAAIASFTSYTIGHALGAATLTGGAVRLRIYSVWGLRVSDIAKIAFITGMTFWLGNALVLGGALSYAPQAASVVDQLPTWMNRSIGLLALCGVAVYLLWLMPRRRVVGFSHWRITLPKARFTLVQIGIGATDLTLVTLAIYTLLPSSPPVAFVTVLVVFLGATLVGTVSHVPGNLGVIEAAMLIGLPQFETEGLLASLLMFRLLYFVIPLGFAMLVLALRELGLVARPTANSQRP
jgi:glycosyltransferase 2 family protein